MKHVAGFGAAFIVPGIIAISIAAAPLSALAALIPAPDDKTCVISLDGPWRFKLEQADSPTTRPIKMGYLPKPNYPAQVEPFYRTEYSEDKHWQELTVPGNWEMAGFSVATWDQPDNASGLYRKVFEVPSEWNGQRVIADFDGVQNGAEIWC